MQELLRAAGLSQRWVVKVGSSLVTNDGQGLNLDLIEHWAGQIATLREQGKDIVLVSSGSVAEGVVRLGWRQRPHALHQLQAAAAVGQMGLIQTYESSFQRYGIGAAQVLLTHADLSNRQRYLNTRITLRTLLKYNVVPVVNENDTVATDEIRFGDNDTLAGLVANSIEAGLLVILTDQEGLFDADPRSHANAEKIDHAHAGDQTLEAMAGRGSVLGRGGMRTKLTAAKLAARSGAATIIASGKRPGVLNAIAAGQSTGTLLTPNQEPMNARKLWLAGTVHPKGTLTLDEGAVRVLKESGRSLLAVGVTGVSGDFSRGDLTVCFGPDQREIARGLVNYSAAETAMMLGQPSERIETILGYVGEPELIHRDNLVLV